MSSFSSQELQTLIGLQAFKEKSKFVRAMANDKKTINLQKNLSKNRTVRRLPAIQNPHTFRKKTGRPFNF